MVHIRSYVPDQSRFIFDARHLYPALNRGASKGHFCPGHRVGHQWPTGGRRCSDPHECNYLHKTNTEIGKRKASLDKSKPTIKQVLGVLERDIIQMI